MIVLRLSVSKKVGNFVRFICKNMKKIFFSQILLLVAVSLSAQLAWDTEFSSSDFNNALTVISKTENVSFSGGLFGIGGGLSIGKVSVFSEVEDECVIALSQTGIAEKLFFSWSAAGGTLSISQSADHNNWSQVFSVTGGLGTSVTSTADSAVLLTNTRYLKFAMKGKVAATFKDIRVSELKRLSVSTDEWPFGAAMVDDAEAVKTVTVTWTNVVASVTSTDPHFVTSLSSVGQKNQIDQTTSLTISYLHGEAGTHSGEIVIAGEGRQCKILVSGSTSKYGQTLTWNQTLAECLTTDRVTFNGFTSSGLDVFYLSSDTTVAKVDGNALRILRSGRVDITATQPGNYKYNASEQITKSLVIRKADPSVIASAEDITYGQRLQEAVLHENNGLVDGSLSWLNLPTDTILDAGDYTFSVLFTPADTGLYNYRELSVALIVNKAQQIITWTAQDTALVVGVPVPATAVLSSGLPVTYAYTRCLINIEDGVVTPENEGEVTVVAFHSGNSNYLPTTVILKDFTVTAPEVPTFVEQLTPQQIRAANKFLHNGKVLIYYEGRTYDAEGRKVN